MNKVILTERFDRALAFAVHLHRHHTRKADGTPYIAHLLGVTALVLEDGGSEVEAIAALLHDAVEDQGGEATRKAILEQFGEEVTAIVDGCTESMQTPKPPWRDRKQQYLQNLRDANASVVRVSLADKLHNGRSLLFQLQRQGATVWRHFHQPPEDTLWFYRELLALYSQHSQSPQVEEFAGVVDAIAQFPPTS
ncbi:HD domain-containing protein [Spirulina sp. 06S082]|uniref:HD domain-containing protein n=1 Tax=Spirulina sp. 06S082 TaxID=3110248 RepID=UPI002B20BE15|nr:HD domain-containing protein [Spirulina sp. 06S082]MEA5469909.1 HD domain-containing protein [Spirulina sp. 06S082]